MREWRWPVFLFSLALVIRLAYQLQTGNYTNPEESELVRAARTLATKGYMGDVYPGVVGPSAHIAPGYAVFLSGFDVLFGHGTRTQQFAVSLFATLLTCCSISWLPGIARRCGLPVASGVIAALLLAMVPFNLFHETSGSWEQPLASLLFLALIDAFFRSRNSGWQSGATVWLGLVAGGIALSTPAILPAAPLLFLVAVIKERGQRLAVCRAALISAGVCILVITPWIIRNYRVFGTFVPLRSNFGLEFRIGNNDEANGKTDFTEAADPNSPFYRLHPFQSAVERQRLIEMGEIPYMAYCRGVASEWIRSHPVRFAELSLNRLGIFWFPPPRMWDTASAIPWFKSAFYRVLALGMILGLIRLLWRGQPAGTYLAMALVGGCCTYLISHVDIRYRVPMLGISTLLASDFLLATLQKVGATRTGTGGVRADEVQ